MDLLTCLSFFQEEWIQVMSSSRKNCYICGDSSWFPHHPSDSNWTCLTPIVLDHWCQWIWNLEIFSFWGQDVILSSLAQWVLIIILSSKMKRSRSLWSETWPMPLDRSTWYWAPFTILVPEQWEKKITVEK
jgi:hypothetical protein